jgi:predicted DNA-binding transcriptional regulator AlpA
MSSTKKAPATQVEAASQRLIFRPDVLDRVGVTYPTVWKMMRNGTFPRSRVIGGRTAWIEAEVEAWIAALPVRRLKGDSEAA